MKKILLKSIIGFFIGITILVLEYISVYFLLGEDAFITEISQLQNVNVLICQTLFFGISYFLFAVIYNFIIYCFGEDFKNGMCSKNLDLASILSVILVLTLAGIAGYLLAEMKVYSDVIEVLNTLVFVVVCTVPFIISSIVAVFQSKLISDINKFIKERNKNNT